MPSPLQQSAGPGEFRLFVLILLGVLALAMVVNFSLRPPDPTEMETRLRAEREWKGLPNYIQQPEAAREHVSVLAERSGGDFDRLSEEEQRWLDAMTAGNGRRMLRDRAERLRAEAAARQKPQKPDRKP